MNWLIISIIAYLFLTITLIIERILLTKSIPHPLVYAFYVGFLSVFILVLAPFGLIVPGFWQILISLLTGLLYLFGLIVFYQAIRQYEVSRVVPMVGSLEPIFTLVLSFVFLDERLSFWQITAFFVLVIGGIFISLEKGAIGYLVRSWGLVLLAAFIFGLFYVLSKYIYLNQPFISGLIWGRLGSFLGALILLLLPQTRKIIFGVSGAVKQKTKISLIFLSSFILAALALFFIHYAVSLGSVSLVKALQGVQYIFLLLMVVFLAKKFPRLLEEKITKAAIIQKLAAILLISLGLGILAISG
ncbi:MAG: hypothetical protein A3A94_00480 [Candidatus Portnoybacteria bacterium RIFCSPLOWO2_01_FULL_43_11]|uniref:EamA domain-containing protein n=4 Tax=Candidatus Portnoyibacteriota TaxID=1817913 RepID=A0A1G2FC13_9BACT|nr:MAG: hypothetical protein A2815_01705 [Candidatus Portnoybacteria bacterium RIFCSPHIGHO2_01_FULL_40_12b]OGZ39041.1 MAG: hypothetical protein A3E90_01345 [Candidatus Portnoybacteria bacterium RIFCSPHIGHO2_12_FULL_40_11]OGZ39214.1 MAG: hypothetical protein A3A94_00480 [Candidatus Portnoybacteria bacterium RIFCSPLOWO2_01_FULL_43_11]OGZ39751.1 MAG: hypothetical protein A3I20_03085 [Candidatus Portnoybacteria bacterium RIFCSPLOWO2_02_FULL_40_15]